MISGFMNANNASTNLIPETQFVIQDITSPYNVASDPFYLIGIVFDSLANGEITFGVLFFQFLKIFVF
jgi:hypothetical protein